MIRKDDEAGPESKIEAPLAEFREAWFRGERPDPDAFCRRHSEIGEELREWIDAFLLVARTLRPVQPQAKAGETARGARPDHESGQRILGDYRLLDEVGRGGMGVVYEAVQVSLERHVALKVLPANITLSVTAVRRFRREATIAARLHHPGIVPVHAVGEADGHHFFSMPFIEGAPLDRVIEHLRVSSPALLTPNALAEAVSTTAHRPKEDVGGAPAASRPAAAPAAASASASVSWGQSYVEAVCRLVLQVAEALDHAHRAGVLHRDVKPANILVTEEARALVADFGLGREEGLPSITGSRELAGTPHYLSPEQATKGPHGVDQRSDIYSLGVTLYELLTLRRPFDGKSTRDVMARVTSAAEAVPPRDLNPQIPYDLERLCLTAMEKRPERRYSTMAALAEDLRRFLEYRPLHARYVGLATRSWRTVRRHPWQAAAIAAGVGLILTIPALIVQVRARYVLQRAILNREMVEQRYERVLSYWAGDLWVPADANGYAGAPRARAASRTIRAAILEGLSTFGKHPALDPELRLYEGRFWGTMATAGGLDRVAVRVLSETYDLAVDRFGLNSELACDINLRLARALQENAFQVADEEGIDRPSLDLSRPPRDHLPERTHDILQVAERKCRRVKDLWQATRGPSDKRTRMAKGLLAGVLGDLRRYEEAVPLLEDVLAEQGDESTMNCGQHAAYSYLLGLDLFLLGRHDEAAPWARAAYDPSAEDHCNLAARRALRRAIELARRRGTAAHGKQSPALAPEALPTDVPPLLIVATRVENGQQQWGLLRHDPSTGESREVVGFSTRPLWSLAVSPDNSRAALVSGAAGPSSSPCRVAVLPIDPGSEEWVCWKGPSIVNSVAWFPDGRRLALEVVIRGSSTGGSALVTIDPDGPPDQPLQPLIARIPWCLGDPTIATDGNGNLTLAHTIHKWDSAAGAREVAWQHLTGPRDSDGANPFDFLLAAGRSTQLTDDTLPDEAPCFSPDGKTLFWLKSWYATKHTRPALWWVASRRLEKTPPEDGSAGTRADEEWLEGTFCDKDVKGFALSSNGTVAYRVREGGHWVLEIRRPSDGQVAVVAGNGWEPAAATFAPGLP